MRQKRAKAYKKQMATYERTFKFRSPYQVLITADFLTAARSFHLDPIAGLKRTIQGDLKCMISQCCIKTLYDAKDQTEISLAKTFERRRCGHVDTPESPDACVSECVGSKNKNRYVVATQDVNLRKALRNVPGVPLIYLNRSVMILEPPSPATLMYKSKKEREVIGLSTEEAVTLGKRKRTRATGTIPGQHKDDESAAMNLQQTQQEPETRMDSTLGNEDALPVYTAPQEGQGRKKRRRGKSGPNPLSAKKPKVTASDEAKTSSSNGALPAVEIGDVVINEQNSSQTAGTAHKRKRRHRTKSSTTMKASEAEKDDQ